MNETDSAPQFDWAAMGWITDRLPTCQDADSEEDVRLPIRSGICDPREDFFFANYRTVVAVGQPWWPPDGDDRANQHWSPFRLAVEPQS